MYIFSLVDHCVCSPTSVSKWSAIGSCQKEVLLVGWQPICFVVWLNYSFSQFLSDFLIFLLWEFQIISSSRGKTCSVGVQLYGVSHLTICLKLRFGWQIAENAAVIIQCHLRRVAERKKYLKIKEAVVKLQLAWKRFLLSDYRQTRCSAATIIQAHIRGWILKKRYLHQKQAALKIQCVLRSLRYLKNFREYTRATKSAIIVQSHVRGLIARRDARRHRNCILMVQVS